jgi:hypothetical protein
VECYPQNTTNAVDCSSEEAQNTTTVECYPQNTTNAVDCSSEEAQNVTTAVQNSNDEKEVIYLLVLLPYFNPIPALNPSFADGDGLRPALDLAADQINSNPLILGNYTLELVHGRDGCDVVTETILGFVEEAFSPRKTGYTGVVGPGCSTSTISLSTIANTLSLVLLHGGGSPVLSDRTLHPHLLGTLGSTEVFVNGFNALIRKAGWKRVALLYDDSRLYYLSTKKLFVDRLPRDVNLLLKPSSFTFLPLNVIQEQLFRIVFIMCPLELTQRVICLAASRNMVHPNYQFAIMSHVVEDVVSPITFTYDQVMYNCSRADMQRAIDMAIFLNYILVPTSGAQIVSNVSYMDYLDEYAEYRKLYEQRMLKDSKYSRWNTYLYDAVWAWALVLDNLTKSDVNFTINADYGDVNQSRLIVEQFYKTSFQGISGKISFMRETGYSPREVNITQAKGNKWYHIATIDAIGRLRFQNSSRSANLDFIEDSFRNKTLRENRFLAIFFNIVTASHIFIVVILHIETIVYHKRPSIKATSPKLLHMSYVGVYFTLIGIFLWTLNPAAAIAVESRPIFCNLLWTWCIPMGYTLIFCPVAVRTWRIYRIFKHYLNPGKLISDPILIGAVLLVLAVDVIMGVVWTATDFFVIKTNVFILPESEGQVNAIGVQKECQSEYAVVWFSILFAYKFIILFAVTIFAILTRKIANRSFATTTLRVLVFLLAIIMPLGFSIYWVVVTFNLDGPMSYFSFTTVCLLSNVMGALCVICIFIPPLIPIFKKQKKALKLATITSSSKLEL